jgi:predicted transcriptional regulator
MANMHTPGRRAPGQLEDETLAALWSAAHPLTPAEVQRVLAGDLAYTTVMTILTRLYGKGLVQRVPLRRGYAYRPAEGQAAFAAQQMRDVLDQGPDRSLVLQQFVERLQPDEEQLIRRVLQGRSGED